MPNPLDWPVRERRRSCAHLLVDQVETSSTAVAQLAAPWQATTTEFWSWVRRQPPGCGNRAARFGTDARTLTLIPRCKTLLCPGAILSMGFEPDRARGAAWRTRAMDLVGHTARYLTR